MDNAVPIENYEHLRANIEKNGQRRDKEKPTNTSQPIENEWTTQSQ